MDDEPEFTGFLIYFQVFGLLDVERNAVHLLLQRDLAKLHA